MLLHGLPGNASIWEPQVAGLADAFDVIAWDAPGCGRSGDPPAEPTLSSTAASLVAFLAALGVDHPHVVGLSWGAGLALELSRIAPAIPASLVLAGGYAGWAGSLPPGEVGPRLDTYLRAAEDDPHVAMRRFAPGYFSSAPSSLVDTVVERMADYHPAALASLARSFAETDLRPHLPNIAVPTLVLHGDADVRSPLSVGEALAAAVPGAQLEVLEGVGHLSSLEAPDRFNQAVRRFLTERSA